MASLSMLQRFLTADVSLHLSVIQMRTSARVTPNRGAVKPELAAQLNRIITSGGTLKRSSLNGVYLHPTGETEGL